MNAPKIELKYTPLPKQAEFHESPARYRAFVGGMGSGKSLCGVAESIQLSLEFAGNRGLIGRATYPELRDTVWKELLNFPVAVDGEEYRFIDSPLVYSYNKANHEILLSNGSSIIGRPLDDSFDKLAKGLNLGWFYADELTEIDREIWTGITRGRLRLRLKCPIHKLFPSTVDKEECPKCGMITIRRTAFGTTNPEGHDWVWQEFVMKPSPDHFYVSSTSTDNTYLSTEYLEGLNKMPDEWKKRYRDGSFDTFEGLVYKDFIDASPYVRPFEIQNDWYHFIGLDHGYRNPTAILWGQVSPSGRLYIYDEYYAAGKLVSDITEVIRTKNKGRKITGWLIDPSCGNRNGVTGRSIIDEFADYDLYFDRANNEVRAGINHIQEMMKRDSKGNVDLVIHPQCVGLRTELQTYRWKDIKIGNPTNAPEKPLKKDDHLVDALRYMGNYIFDTPELKKKDKKFDYSLLLKRSKVTEISDYMAA